MQNIVSEIVCLSEIVKKFNQIQGITEKISERFFFIICLFWWLFFYETMSSELNNSETSNVSSACYLRRESI